MSFMKFRSKNSKYFLKIIEVLPYDEINLYKITF